MVSLTASLWQFVRLLELRYRLGTLFGLFNCEIKTRFFSGLVLLGSVPLADRRQQNVADFATFQTITHEENRDKIPSQPTLPKFTNNPVNKDLPIFLGIGVDDGIQTDDEEKMTLNYLKSMFGGNPHFVRHGPNLGHTTNKQQLNDVANFIAAICPTVIQTKF